MHGTADSVNDVEELLTSLAALARAARKALGLSPQIILAVDEERGRVYACFRDTRGEIFCPHYWKLPENGGNTA